MKNRGCFHEAYRCWCEHMLPAVVPGLGGTVKDALNLYGQWHPAAVVPVYLSENCLVDHADRLAMLNRMAVLGMDMQLHQMLHGQAGPGPVGRDEYARAFYALVGSFTTKPATEDSRVVKDVLLLWLLATGYRYLAGLAEEHACGAACPAVAGSYLKYFTDCVDRKYRAAVSGETLTVSGYGPVLEAVGLYMPLFMKFWPDTSRGYRDMVHAYMEHG